MRIAALIPIITCALAAGVQAQTTSPRVATERQSAVEPAPPRADATPDLLRQNGGSLLRAQLAGSAVADRNSLEAVSFFHVPPPEPRVIQKHDLVTIIIREESSSKSDAKADITRESDIDARLEEWIKISGFDLSGGGVTDPIPAIKASASREFQGDGQLDRKDSFIARIQAEVIDVKPNGSLVLQARKRIKTDEEEQMFILSGIARAEDVTADNSVLSTQLFDLEVSKSTQGSIRDSVKRGAIHRVLDWLNPF